MKKNEATLISYKLTIDKKGRVFSERSISEIDELEKKLKPIMFHTLKAVLRRAKADLDNIHNRIEADLNGRIQ
jgi:molecular chaperone GrpE (heat shock protein)